MGRTVPSFRMELEKIILDLSEFRRALRSEDKIAFDNIMNKARAHASSSTMVPTFDPMESIFISVLIEQEKEIKKLKDSLKI